MPDVVIVGGGIGGLTAALCLTQAGLHVRVLEQVHQFGEVGAGVQLGPNATRVLARLGLGKALGQTGFRPDAVRLMRWADSTPLTEQPLAAAAEQEFGSPYYTLYRPDLVAPCWPPNYRRTSSGWAPQSPVSAPPMTEGPSCSSPTVVPRSRTWSSVRTEHTQRSAPPRSATCQHASPEWPHTGP